MFVAVDTNFFRHPKTRRFCLRMGTSLASVYVTRLWAEVCEFAPDGDLSRFSPEEIEDLVDYRPLDGGCYRALVDCGWIDELPDGRRVVHDWMDHHGKWLAKLSATKERMRSLRSKRRTDSVTPAEARLAEAEELQAVALEEACQETLPLGETERHSCARTVREPFAHSSRTVPTNRIGQDKTGQDREETEPASPGRVDSRPIELTLPLGGPPATQEPADEGPAETWVEEGEGPEPKSPGKGRRPTETYSAFLAFREAHAQVRAGFVYVADGKDMAQLKLLLKRMAEAGIDAAELPGMFLRYCQDNDPFALKQGHSLAWFCTGNGVNKYRLSRPRNTTGVVDVTAQYKPPPGTLSGFALIQSLRAERNAEYDAQQAAKALAT